MKRHHNSVGRPKHRSSSFLSHVVRFLISYCSILSPTILFPILPHEHHSFSSKYHCEIANKFKLCSTKQTIHFTILLCFFYENFQRPLTNNKIPKKTRNDQVKNEDLIGDPHNINFQGFMSEFPCSH